MIAVSNRDEEAEGDSEEGSAYEENPLLARLCRVCPRFRTEDGGNNSSASDSDKAMQSSGFCGNRRLLCGVGCSCCILAVAFLFISGLSLLHQKPSWEVISIEMRSISLPSLGLDGMAAADNSGCPTLDKCGVGAAQGCSRCPGTGMWNGGCLCFKKAPNGAVMKAETSNCRNVLDPCGLTVDPGCSTCPDSTWINDGCDCRKPLSPEQFMSSLSGLKALLFPHFVSQAEKNKSLISLELFVAVRVHNPSPLTAYTEDGIFQVLYDGRVIATASCEPGFVEANGFSTLEVHVKITEVPEALGMQMMHEILTNQNQILVHVEGSIVAKLLFLKVHCMSHCTLKSDVSTISATHSASFSRKDCEYSYSAA